MFFVEAHYHRNPKRAADQVRYIAHREEGLPDGQRRELYGIGQRYRALRGDEKAIQRALVEDARGLRNPAYFRFILTVDNRTAELNRPVPRLTKAQADQLTAHDWPGNIRELQHAVERATILAQGGPLHFDLSPNPALGPAKPSAGEAASLLTRDGWKLRERESIEAALKQSGGKLFGPGGAAERLNMKPTTLASRIKALGLDREKR